MDATQAWAVRNVAMKNLRFKRAAEYYETVLQADDELVQAIAEKRNDPPNPKLSFTYGEIAYVLQSYTEGNARYVPVEKFNPDEYVYEPISKVDRVRAELSVRAQVEYEIEILKEYFPEMPLESL